MSHAPRSTKSATLTEDILIFLSQRTDPLLGTNIADFKRSEKFKQLDDTLLTNEVIRMAYRGKVKLRFNPKGQWRVWVPKYFTLQSESLPGRAYVPTLVCFPRDKIHWEQTILATVRQTGSCGISTKLLNDIYWSEMEIDQPDLEDKTYDHIQEILSRCCDSSKVYFSADDYWIHPESISMLDQNQISTLLTLNPLARLIFTQQLLDAPDGLTSVEITTWARKNLLLDRDDHLEVAWALKSLKGSRLVHSVNSGGFYPNLSPIKIWKLGPPTDNEPDDDSDHDEELSAPTQLSGNSINLTISFDRHFTNIDGLSVRLKGSETYLPIALPQNASIKLYPKIGHSDNPRLVIWDDVEKLLISTNDDEEYFDIAGPLGIQID